MTPRLSLTALLQYGLFGLPLAMVALPIYVYVPQFYAQRSGLSLATIGAALLTARLLAAFIDPALGWWMERGHQPYARYVALALAPLLLGFGALFHPPAWGAAAMLGWFLSALLLVYTGFSMAMIAHQSWGAALSPAVAQRARLTAMREGCGLLGVIGAAGVEAAFGYDVLALAFSACLLLAAALLLRHAPRPPPPVPQLVPMTVPMTVPMSVRHPPRAGRFTRNTLLAPFQSVPFRALFAVLIVNGVAAAIPATLFLFFAADRLQLGSYAGLFLMLYFAAAAASMPLWVALARRWGEARAWGAGMLLAACVFVWAYALGAAALWGFGAICLLSGLTLGADLALPPALLAGVIGAADTGDAGGARAAAYFGWWNWGVQLNLALAAGIALPLLGWLGYVPGASGSTVALSVAYCLLPCGLKLLAAAMLWRAPLRDC